MGGIIQNLIALKTFLISFFLLFAIPGAEPVNAQQNMQTESQLAFKYFRDKEFKPASALFFNLYKVSRSKTYFNYYIESLIQLNEFQDAEKFIKKQFKKNPEDKSFLITLGYVYKVSGKMEQSAAQYDKVLEKLIPVQSDINSVANAFVAKREYEYANKTYEQGRKLLKQEHAFHLEMANILLYQKDFEHMVAEYLMAISIDPTKLNLVQNRLQSALLQDINSSLDPILKNQLLKKIQTESNNIAFKELLQWYFIQKKQFKAAFTQARSIDLIRHEDGFRLLALATSARSNKDYETAIKCYQAVIDKGANSSNYLKARMGDLESRYLLLSDENSESKEKWKELSDRYQKFFNEKKRLSLAPSALIQYAHIRAFYLNEETEAIGLLENAIKAKGMHPQNRSKIKMELADIKLFIDEKWDAILLYSQIEKSNKNNPLGFEAKFKKAKVSYYMGELKWAKAQLDALKGSTSKLIANDAIALSQLISDNTTLDTTYTAMKTYAEAEFLQYQKKDSLALMKLDELLKNHPDHSLSDEVYMKKYEILLQRKKEDQAMEYLNKIINEYPWDSLADKALLLLGEIHEKRSNVEKAMESYKSIITEYPDSIHSVEARQRLNDLRKRE